MSIYVITLISNIQNRYGYEILLTLHRLEKLRLLTKRDSPLRWSAVRNKFKLIYNEVNSEKPDDIAYVTSGYAPLSARIVQMAMGNKWKKNEDSLRLLPGPKRNVHGHLTLKL